MKVVRAPYDELPEPVRRTLTDRFGAGAARSDMETGESSGLACLFTRQDGSQEFVKGLPLDHDRIDELRTEIKVNPHLPDFAPRLQWTARAGAWLLLGFEGLRVTPWAHFARGSEHLQPVSHVLRRLSTVRAPDVGLRTLWDRWSEYCDPADRPLLTGDHLVHGDPAATNFLLDHDRKAWLVDWAWAAQGPPWADTALWGLRLTLDGDHTPEQAAALASTVPAFASAPREAVRVLTEAEARSWEDWQAFGMPDLDETVKAARAWADHWRQT
ncbi:aminoglycoside phosphotransferase [Streptomyces sp. NPDC097619]|uniref:phosphotransferase family protein n=1 Tax=Streptomyces sp. NPDC097619 TaxID=3157228 RepID=UPI00331FBF21